MTFDALVYDAPYPLNPYKPLAPLYPHTPEFETFDALVYDAPYPLNPYKPLAPLYAPYPLYPYKPLAPLYPPCTSRKSRKSETFDALAYDATGFKVYVAATTTTLPKVKGHPVRRAYNIFSTKVDQPDGERSLVVAECGKVKGWGE